MKSYLIFFYTTIKWVNIVESILGLLLFILMISCLAYVFSMLTALVCYGRRIAKL